MISPVRQELLRVLADLSAYCLEIRFGQLIANLEHLEILRKRHSPVV